jgi:hypothetical protein
MSLHPSPSVFTLRRAAPSAVRSPSTDRQLFAAVALLVVVLVADAQLILAAAPNFADLASLYVSTT